MSGLPVVQPVSHSDDGGFSGLERAEHGTQLGAHQPGLDGGLGRRRGVVGNEVAERSVVIGTDGLIQADQVAREVNELPNSILWDVELSRELRVGRFPAQTLIHLAAQPLQLVDLLDEMDRQADGAGLDRPWLG